MAKWDGETLRGEGGSVLAVLWGEHNGVWAVTINLGKDIAAAKSAVERAVGVEKKEGE